MVTRNGTEPGGLTAETLPRQPRYCPSCDQSFDEEQLHCPADGTRLVRVREVDDPFIGRNLDGRFEIRERIGAGGMGRVYRAWQHSIGREVAIKVIDARFVHDSMGVRRFLREARLSSQLSQPNTVSVFEFGQAEDGHLYLAMELLRGRTLGDVVREDGTFSPKRTIRVGIQLCDALDAAHGMSIIHRDLKPSNILVLDEPAGRDLVKVLDFGLAKSIEVDETESTLSGKILGTPRYMSPEASMGLDAEPRSDLYSLGVILHELLTGKPLFSAPTLSGILGLKSRPPEVDALIPADLQTLLRNLLSPDPRMRCANAAEVRTRLSQCNGSDEILGATTASGLFDRPATPADFWDGGAAADGADGVPTRILSRGSIPLGEGAQAVVDRPTRWPLWAGVAGVVLAVGIGAAVTIGGLGGADRDGEKPSIGHVGAGVSPAKLSDDAAQRGDEAAAAPAQDFQVLGDPRQNPGRPLADAGADDDGNAAAETATRPAAATLQKKRGLRNRTKRVRRSAEPAPPEYPF